MSEMDWLEHAKESFEAVKYDGGCWSRWEYVAMAQASALIGILEVLVKMDEREAGELERQKGILTIWRNAAGEEIKREVVK